MQGACPCVSAAASAAWALAEPTQGLPEGWGPSKVPDRNLRGDRERVSGKGVQEGLPMSHTGSSCVMVWGTAKAVGPPCKYGPRVVRGSHTTCPL